MKTFREYINLIENAQSSVTESDKYEPAQDKINIDSIPGLNLGSNGPKPKSRLGQGGNRAIQAPDKTKTRGQVNAFKDRLTQKLGMDEGIDHPYDRGLEDGLAGKEYDDSMYSSYEDKESYRRGRIVAKQQSRKQ